MGSMRFLDRSSSSKGAEASPVEMAWKGTPVLLRYSERSASPGAEECCWKQAPSSLKEGSGILLEESESEVSVCHSCGLPWHSAEMKAAMPSLLPPQSARLSTRRPEGRT